MAEPLATLALDAASPQPLAGRCAVVTGAARGIGAAIAIALGRRAVLVAGETGDSAAVCFFGNDLQRAVSANVGRRHLTELDLGLRGAPLHRPDRWTLDA